MDEFPDPEEEFELMYGDELDLLREQNFEDEDEVVNVGPPPMDESPNPEEEFELMHGDEMDLLREQTFEDEVVNVGPPPKARKSLNCQSPSQTKQSDNHPIDKPVTESNPSFESSLLEFEALDSNIKENVGDQGSPPSSQLSVNALNPKKRAAEDLFGDISDILDCDFPKTHS